MNIKAFIGYLQTLLNVLARFLRRLALLMEWRRWERKARRAWEVSVRYDAMRRADELAEIIFKEWEG